jgi:hypothetical protein
MPDPNPGGTVDLSDAPFTLDNATFDSLFPADSPVVVAQVTTPSVQGSTPPPPPPQTSAQPQTPSAPYLKGAKSIYNTPEAAVQGIDQKDALIDQLRQRYALTTGIDPITGQPVNGVAAPQKSDSYYQNPEKYLEDLYQAASKGGPQAYRDVQGKFIMDALSPMQPYLQRAARDQALDALSTQIPDSRAYIGSPQYQVALDANPELKNAIVAAETDMKWHSRLTDLYRVAYYTGKGMQLPEILKTATPSQQPTTQTPVRPTMQSTTPNPPTVQTQRPGFRGIESIRGTIAEMEARGAKLEF